MYAQQCVSRVILIGRMNVIFLPKNWILGCEVYKYMVYYYLKNKFLFIIGGVYTC